MNTLELAKLKHNLLQEIGDGSSQPYTWKQTKDLEDFKSFQFQTTSKLNYVLTVRLQIQDLSSYDWDSAIVEFGIAKGADQKPDYSVNTNAGELYRVMATVVEILKKIIETIPTITYIRFEAEKQGHKSSKRTNLYTLYLQSHIENAKVDKIKDTKEGEVIVMHLSPTEK